MVMLGLSGYEPNRERLDRAVGYFEARHWSVRVDPAPENAFQRFAATDAERLAALSRAVADKDVRLLMALRGGYGVTALLDSIDFGAVSQAVRDRGLSVVGHSDFTVFGLALLAHDGTPTLAGPMATFDFGAEMRDPFMEQHFWDVLEQPRATVQWDAPGASCEREGILWGGNLAMLCSLLGTRHFPDVHDGIMFVEDINEQPYRVERMLMQLFQAGVLGRQSALLCGDFSGFRVTDYDRGYSMDAALDRVAGHLSIPVIKRLPFGHIPAKATLRLGAHAELKSTGGRCSLSF